MSRLQRLRASLSEKVRGYPPRDELVRRGLVLGDDVRINRGVIIDPNHCHLVSIGDNVGLAPNVMILAHDASTKRHIGYSRIARVRIGSKVFIGAGSIILPGVTIGDDAIVGAGSVVSRDVPAGAIVAGNPAKVVGETAAYVEKHRARLHQRPTYSRDGFTYRVGISPENRERMISELEDGPGYVH
jgi:maltose O-acetyltransferase